MQLGSLKAAHIKDGQVEENEKQLEAYAQQALQLAHDCLSVFQRSREVLAVVVDLYTTENNNSHNFYNHRQAEVPASTPVAEPRGDVGSNTGTVHYVQGIVHHKPHVLGRTHLNYCLFHVLRAYVTIGIAVKCIQAVPSLFLRQKHMQILQFHKGAA